MKKNLVFFVIFFIATLFMGICIGACEYRGALNGIKWTNVASLLINILGFSLAFYTYHQWLNNKKREDSYLSAKKYLSAIDQVHECLNELSFYYPLMCPAPGVVGVSKEVSAQRIEYVNKVCHELYQSKVMVLKSKRELAFWNVSLTEGFRKKHDEFIKELHEINVISHCLNSQLHYYFHSKDGNNMAEVTKEKAMLDEKLTVVYKIINERIDMGFEKLFLFK